MVSGLPLEAEHSKEQWGKKIRIWINLGVIVDKTFRLGGKRFKGIIKKGSKGGGVRKKVTNLSGGYS